MNGHDGKRMITVCCSLGQPSCRKLKELTPVTVVNGFLENKTEMVLRHCHTYCYPWTNEDSHCISSICLDNRILDFIHLLTPTMTWKLRYQNVKLVTIITWYTFVKKEKVRRKVGHEEGERKVEGEHFNLQNQNLEDTNNKTFMFYFKRESSPTR